jgi:hemerythrin-like metal-binding protein
MADHLAPLGIAALDDEHLAMAGMLRAFQIALTKRRPDHELRSLIDRSMALLCAHYRHEEALMAKSAYSGAPAHRLEHERLVLAAIALSEEVLHHRLAPDVLIEHSNVLRSLFIAHMNCEDRALADHLMSLETA